MPKIIHECVAESLFVKKSLKEKDLGDGVSCRSGKLLTDPDGAEVEQSVSFDKEKYDLEKAKAWLRHNGYPLNTAKLSHTYAEGEEPEIVEEEKPAEEPAPVMPKELKSIYGVEVFASGTWNGDLYTPADLDEMVRAFDQQKGAFLPPLKLGHDDNQAMLQKDGMPAAGWVGNLYRKGTKLVADFIDMPEKIFDLIQMGAYKKVSSEIYWDADFEGNKYGRMLGAVSLLGADMPAVTCLNDILAMYIDQFKERKTYTDSN